VTKEKTMDIKVLGPGCQRCTNLYEETAKVLQHLGLQANLAKVADMDEILKYKILATPGLVIDGEVKSAGRIPSQAEITTWITTAAMKQSG
jgi:small redox-active disulfide protein 2